MALPRPAPHRLDALDAARGIAITLMILSHTVKGLLWFRDMPDWGIVPVHLVTKFSSSLFIIVFALSMTVAYGVKAGTPLWPKARSSMLLRGLLLLVWYKILTVVQMFERYETKTIVETLLWIRFPDFVEILQFYGFMMLVLPLLLPAWKGLSLWPKLGIAYGIGLASFLLRLHYDFGGIWQLQAIFVEHEDAFCFGLLSRGSMVLFGMAAGDAFFSRVDQRAVGERNLVSVAAVIGLAFLSMFATLYWDDLNEVLGRLARNGGKHPPTQDFILFSVGGALVVLAFVVATSRVLSWVYLPFRVLGRQSFFCFNLHVLVIFLVYRWALGLRQEVTYLEALQLTLANLIVCIVGSFFWERLKSWRKKPHEIRRIARPAGGDEDPEITDVTEVVDFGRPPVRRPRVGRSG